MPFIFHSKKESIFDTKQEDDQNNKQNKLGAIQHDKTDSEPKYKVNIQICKQHPFRKFSPVKQEKIFAVNNQILNYPTKDINLSSIQRKSKINPISSTLKSLKNQLNRNQENDINQFQICPNNLNCNNRIHADCKQKEKNAINSTIANEYKAKQIKQLERLVYNIQNTPGPGTYEPKKVKNDKTTVFYGDQENKNYPLPPKKSQSSLQKNKINQNVKSPLSKSTQKYSFYCSYKNQPSAIFKKSVLESRKNIKNATLLQLLLLNKKNTQIKPNKQKSKIISNEEVNKTYQNQIQKDEQYLKNQQISPSPYTYNYKSCFEDPDKIKCSKYFISASPKFQPLKGQFSKTPGPGKYTKQILDQKHQFFSLNQNSTKIGPWKQQKNDKNCGFLSKLPRQLHFDTQNLGKQQFYYSPKNNLMDIVNEKTNKNSKLWFGSSLERFQRQQRESTDHYKYCFSKDKYNKKNNLSSCVSLKSKAKRQLFQQEKKSSSPLKFQNKSKTIQQQVQKQFFKRLLRSKYQDQMIFMKQKKNKMQRVLIDDQKNRISFTKQVKNYENINQDKYQQFLWKQKVRQKSNISFGSNKVSPLNRSIKPVQQLDVYYQTEPTWDINSFNKYYGYDYQYS